MGDRCTQYRFLNQPAKLRKTSMSDICDRCLKQGYTAEDSLAASSPPQERLTVCSQCGSESVVSDLKISLPEDRIEVSPLCEDCQERLLQQWNEGGFITYSPSPEAVPEVVPEDAFKELLQAARVMLEAGKIPEDQVAPTLAFANRASALPQLEAKRAKFAESRDDPDQWEELAVEFYRRFRGLLPVRFLHDVLVLERIPMFVDALTYFDGTVVKEINIDVFVRSVKPEELAEHYKKILAQKGISWDKSSRGLLSWDISDGYLSMRVGPGRELSPEQASRFTSMQRQQVFPPPRLVGEHFKTLKGSVNSRDFRGIAYALSGRQSGDPTLPDNLIPACVAWYLQEPGGITDKHKMVRLLNRHLLSPCGRMEVGMTSDYPIWRNIGRASDSIMRAELALQKGTVLR
jgi:hypothetical protein